MKMLCPNDPMKFKSFDFFYLFNQFEFNPVICESKKVSGNCVDDDKNAKRKKTVEKFHIIKKNNIFVEKKNA